MNFSQKILEIITSPEITLLDGLKRMDSIRRKLLLVQDKDRYIGLLSVGDIQRAIINNVDLSCPVSSIIRKDYIIANPGTSIEEIKKMMLVIRAEFMPVVANNGDLVTVYFWEDLFGEKEIIPVKQFNLPVVIMAGGIGTRLKPLTNVLPKPLVPIGKRTVIEEIFDRFANHGCKDFYISVNYKADLIEFYLDNLNLPYHLEFFREEKPMGTIGSLSLLRKKINKSFFVSNCDILIDQDYTEILNFHSEQKNEITIIAALKQFPIAYGTIETGENGQLINLTEKPELTFKINSGMYLLEPNLIDEIPENEFFHITDLIGKLLRDTRKVGVFPVSENSWTDIGDWDTYLKHSL